MVDFYSRISIRRVVNSNRLSASSDTTNTSVNVDTISFDDVNTRNELQRASDEVFMRSRNTEFKVSNLNHPQDSISLLMAIVVLISFQN